MTKTAARSTTLSSPFLRGLVRAERPDALVVAGDVFDVRQPTPAAQRRYYQFIADLRNDGACGRLILIAGNHDSAALLAAPKELLAQLNATVVARRRSRFGSGSPPMSGRPSPTPPPSAPPTQSRLGGRFSSARRPILLGGTAKTRGCAGGLRAPPVALRASPADRSLPPSPLSPPCFMAFPGSPVGGSRPQIRFNPRNLRFPLAVHPVLRGPAPAPLCVRCARCDCVPVVLRAPPCPPSCPLWSFPLAVLRGPRPRPLCVLCVRCDCSLAVPNVLGVSRFLYSPGHNREKGLALRGGLC